MEWRHPRQASLHAYPCGTNTPFNPAVNKQHLTLPRSNCNRLRCNIFEKLAGVRFAL